MALARFRVESSFGPVVPWDRVKADLERAFAGRLALTARLDERARTYAGRRARRRRRRCAPGVAFDNRASATATVIDVQAPDSIGLLHRITRALAELDLDIRKAQGVDGRPAGRRRLLRARRRRRARSPTRRCSPRSSGPCLHAARSASG